MIMLAMSHMIGTIRPIGRIPRKGGDETPRSVSSVCLTRLGTCVPSRRPVLTFGRE